MPTEIELKAWSSAVRAPVLILIVASILLVALAMATGVAPAPMYADPAPLNLM